MPDKKLTDAEIFETEIKCIQRRSSGHCNGGSDCCHCDLLMNEQDIISAYERAIANFDLINSLQEENENLKDVLYDADGVNLVNYWYQQCKIAENGCKNYGEENKNLKAEIERLKDILLCFMDALGKVRKVDDIDEISLIPLMSELNKQYRAELKSEAYKEFAERVKQEFFDSNGYYDTQYKRRIDNLLKELVGENNEMPSKE